MKTRHNFLTVMYLLGVSLIATLTCPQVSGQSEAPQGKASPSQAQNRPNILWITSEDNGPQLGCYGDSFATTPNIDALARKGLRYDRCWSNAPVCAPARTTIITGMYATALGASNMRSRATLPSQVKLLPELLREQGYYCTNNHKEDYNFNLARKPWNESSKNAHWRNRPADAPFFSVFNLGMTHESQIRKRPHVAKHSAASVPVPPYYPDLPEVRQDWAQYYDKIEEMDTSVGKILAELESDGLADSTIVFYFGDHGSGMARSKRWLYESGLRVPLVVHFPERFRSLAPSDYQPGGASTRLVSFVDLVPSVLSLAEVPAPGYLQGKTFLGAEAVQNTVLFGFRDRMDERIDMSRAVRNDRYLYVRNFIPQIPQGVQQHYMFQTPSVRAWKRAYESGALKAEQSFFWRAKPVEELYEIQADPFQITNLAQSSAHADALTQLRGDLKGIMITTRDHGVIPEAILKSNEPYEDWNWDEMVTAAFDSTSLSPREVHLESANPVARFWAARGLLQQAINLPEVSQARDEIYRQSSRLETDSHPMVRLYAQGAVIVALNKRSPQTQSENAASESSAQLQEKKRDLLSDCDPRQHGLLHAVAAINLVHELAINGVPFASSDLLKLQQNPAKDPELEQVYQELIPRLLDSLTSQETR